MAEQGPDSGHWEPDDENALVECPCCLGNGSTWPERRGYECIMCHGRGEIRARRLPEWDHIVSSA